MGKKKFDKNKGVTFKLIYKSSDDQDASADKTLSERIFSVIEQQKKTAEKEDDQERKKILSQFTKQELGEAPIKKKKDPNQAANPEYAAISSHAKGRNDLWITHLMRMKEQAKAQAEAEIEEEEEEEERKQKESSKQKAILDKLRNKALKKHNEKELKKAKGTEEKDDEDEDGEGWESCEDDGEEEEGDDDEEEEYEEWEEEEEEEYEEYEVDEEELAKLQIQGQGILKKESTLKKAGAEEEEEEIKLVKAKPAEDNKNGLVFEEIQVSKAPQVHFEDFPTLGTGEVMEFEHVDIPLPPKAGPKTEEEKVEEKAEEEIDLKRTIVQGDVKMQRFDEMGLPIDGYNYYQHVVDANSGGAPQFAYTVTYDHVVNLPEDNDFRLEKMNAEERELYEALEYDNADGAYEDLDDDFFGAINKESNVKLEEGFYDPRQKQKKVTFVEGEVSEITTTKEEPGKKEAKKEEKGGKGKDSILARQDFNKVLDEHVSALKNRFKAERERNKARYGIESSDEEDVEEVEEFSDDEGEEEEDGVREHIDQIPFEKDVAMQEAMKRDLEDTEEEDSDEEEDYDDRKSMRSKGQATVADTEIFSLARKAKLNIIKEKRPDRPAEAEKESKKDEEEEDSEDEEEDHKGKVEEVFKKREKGETKEEKKARKEAIKQFKQERKEKKKKFKENFDDKKKQHLKINQRQATSLQGTTIYKLTV